MKKLSLILLLVSLGAATFAQESPETSAPIRWGITTLSTNFMREKPGYVEENGNQSLMGTVVEILGEESYWIKIKSPEPYTAWVTGMAVREISQAEKDAYLAAPKFICTAEITHIYSKPDAKSQRITDFVMGDLVRQTDITKGKWVKVILPTDAEGWVLRSEVADFAAWAANVSCKAEDVIDMAMKYIGVPYMWGANSIKHVDCSGLTRSVYFSLGVLLPRNASQQVRVGVEVENLQDAVPGDLIFFGRPATEKSPERITHVSIYLGGGRIIHSSHVVRINSIVEGGPDFYSSKPLRIRRIIGNVDNGTGVVSIARSPYYFPQQ